MFCRWFGRTIALLLWAAAARAQTTQAVISGAVVDAITGEPLPTAMVRCIQTVSETSYAGGVRSDGRFTLPLLPPGNYRLRVDAGDNYQGQELYNLELPVSANLEFEFRLRPKKDVLEQYERKSVFLPNNEILVLMGPDVDTSRTGSFTANGGRVYNMETSISNVIDPAEIATLPLQGRDVYTMISTQPGVASDNAIERGLGLSANGQRPSSSNYTLDGLSNNNYLTAGPLAIVAPEGIQEFRLSTNNFTPEYGGTAGYVTTAVTRTGGSAWHALGYLYLRRAGLNAGDYQRNTSGEQRLPVHELEPGFRAGGPIRPGALFGSLDFDLLRYRGEDDPQRFTVPTSLFHPAENSTAAYLLRLYPAPPVPNPVDQTATLMLGPRISLDQYLAVPRIDAVIGPKHRFFARLVVNHLDRPDLIWSPYTKFNVPLIQSTRALGGGWTESISPSLLNEAKIGVGSELLSLQRPHDVVPILQASGVTLPGSHFSFDLRNSDRNWELIDNLTWSVGAHSIKFGGALLDRSLTNSLAFASSGVYDFGDLAQFGRDQIQTVDFTALRSPTSSGPSENPPLPDSARKYRYTQFAAFAQDAWRVTRRFTVNYGVRYEDFGSPRIVGGQTELLLSVEPGVPIANQLATVQLQTRTHGLLYDSVRNNWSVRLGSAYAPTGKMSLRAAYGIYYDRPFDNYWLPLESNSFLRALSANVGSVDYLKPLASNLGHFHDLTYDPTNPVVVTAFAPEIRNARVQSYFLGIQRSLSRSLSVEVDGVGSRGANLIVTDQINRVNSVLQVPVKNPFGLINPELPGPMYYRSSDGKSRYDGLIARAALRPGYGQLSVAYTLSRSYDNQSDPLSGDFLNLNFTGTGIPGQAQSRPYFTTQFQPGIDWGHSDFDQRQNFVFYSVWQLPIRGPGLVARLGRGWTLSQMAALRSGLPFSVIARINDASVIKNRGDLVSPESYSEREPYPGGIRLLNATAFGTPARGLLGNTARNQFAGPGFWGSDISLAREFPLSRAKENLRLIFRADAFNAFNHPNLNNPDSYLEHGSNFGVALYGRSGSTSAFPLLTPFDETARQIQLMLRIQF
jgi:hypothetical protein